MATSADITPEICRQLLRYEPETGRLFWLPHSPEFFSDCRIGREGICRAWNTKFADTEAFLQIDKSGYRCGTLLGRMYKAHRVAFALYKGEWPEVIDHINGDRSDNRIVNLRDVTQRVNSRNIGRRGNNTSGVNGVSWAKRQRKWLAMIRTDEKQVGLGYYSTIEEASAARRGAERVLGYSRQHGRRERYRPPVEQSSK